jgi:hypothetical protein
VKELGVIFDECTGIEDPEDPTEYTSPTHLLSFAFHRFKLTKFVNGYFSRKNTDLLPSLKSQPNLESLELVSGEMLVRKNQLPLHCLKAVGCPPQFLDTSYSMTRLRA